VKQGAEKNIVVFEEIVGRRKRHSEEFHNLSPAVVQLG
jgi:hypothetical protein